MALSVEELCRRLNALTGDAATLSVTWDELDLPGVKKVFSPYVGTQGVTLTKAERQGTYGAKGQVTVDGSTADGTVCFFTDSSTVRGLTLSKAQADWKLPSLPGIDLTFLKTKVAGGSSVALHFLLVAEPEPDGTLTPYTSARLDFSLLSPGDVRMTMARGADKSRATFRFQFPKGVTLKDLATLAAKFAPLKDQQLAALLPTDFPTLKGLSLRTVQAEVSPGAGTVRRASARVQLDCDAWKRLPQAHLTDLSAYFVHTTGGGTRLTMDATCTLYRLALSAHVDVTGGQLFAALEGPVPQPSEVSTYLGDTPLKNARLTDITVGADLRSLGYSFDADLDADWVIDSADDIALTRLRLHLDGVGADTAKLTASMGATLRAATAELEAAATYTDKKWSATAGVHGIAFAPVAAWLEKRKVPVPSGVEKLELVKLAAAWRQGGPMALTVQVRFPLEGALVDYLGVFTKDGTWSSRHRLRLTAGRREIDLTAQIQQNSVQATWSAGQAPGVPAADLLTACGVPVPALPSSMLPALRSFALYYDRAAHTLVVYLKADKVRILFGRLGASTADRRHAVQANADVPSTVPARLSALPLLKGQLPPSEDISVTGLALESATLNDGDVKTLNEALSKLTTKDTFGTPAKGTAVQVTVNLMGSPRTLVASTGTNSSSSATAEGPAGALAYTTGPLPTASAAAAVTWLNVGKSLGPLRVERVGLGLDGTHLQVLFDASLTLAGLTFGVQGLAMKVSLADESVSAGLQGLSLAYRSPAVSLAGAVVDRSGSDPDFDVDLAGMLAVTTPKLALAALGGYQHHVPPDEYTSVFVFARVGGELGGPPPFVLEGLCGGLGINNALVVPALDKLGGFPLLAGIGGDQDPGKILADLRTWLKPAPGAMWAAVGVDFTSFRYAACSALLVAEFGPDLTIALLGRLSASFPLKAEVPGLRPFAQVQLDLRAVYQRSQDQLSVEGQLTPQSYLFSADCVLHGGFAFDNWFGASTHPGDFVCTIGGYHPAFEVPNHYPRPAEVGFTWNPGGGLTVDGGSYLALTPGAVMAGGHLRAAYSTSGSLGSLTAGFTVQADVLVEWDPFHFEAGFTVRAWYRVVSGLLSWHGGEISGEVQFSLTLWGPPTGGTVHIDVWKFSFDVPFGEPRLDPPELGWDDVRERYGPWLRVHAESGVLPRSGKDTAGPLVVSGQGVSFTTHCTMPATSLTFVTTRRQTAGGHRVDLRPLKGVDSLSSLHTATLTRLSATAPRDCDHWGNPSCTHWDPAPQEHWQASTVSGKAPAALWRRPASPSPVPQAGDALVDAVTGWRVTAVRPRRTDDNLAAARSHFTALPQPGGGLPLRADSSVQGPTATTDPDALKKAAEQLVSKKSTRNETCLALRKARITGLDDEELTRLSRDLGHYLAHAPLLCGAAA